MTLQQNNFFSWLGRQVGHVKKAVSIETAAEPKVVYRNDVVEEREMPNQPGVKLRRTTIDEVILDPNQKKLVDSGETRPKVPRENAS